MVRVKNGKQKKRPIKRDRDTCRVCSSEGTLTMARESREKEGDIATNI
jgi:hypothetical protein